MAEPIKSTKVVYRKRNGEDDKAPTAVEMYAIDAHFAVSRHPEEWSFVPFDEEDGEGVELPNGESRAVIPNDWIDLKASEKIKLAHALGGNKDIRTGAAAEEFINRYLIDRANAGVVEEPKELVAPKDPVKPVAPAPLGPADNNPKL